MDANQIDHLLDYGCGSNLSLMQGFRDIKYDKEFTYQCYDPGVPDFADDPVPADLVVSVDVLEHIEPALLESVLDHIESLATGLVFLSIHTGPAGKTLSDGRNAHLTQKPPQWWLPKLWDRFEIQTFQVQSPVEFWVIGHNANLEIEAPETHSSN